MKKETLDCYGEACPIPLLKAEKAIAGLDKGDTLIVRTDHSCAMKNVPDWARKHGHDVEIEEIDDGEWEIAIIKN